MQNVYEKCVSEVALVKDFFVVMHILHFDTMVLAVGIFSTVCYYSCIRNTVGLFIYFFSSVYVDRNVLGSWVTGVDGKTGTGHLKLTRTLTSFDPTNEVISS